MQIVPLTIEHVQQIVERNRADGFNNIPADFDAGVLTRAYLSQGSPAFCLMNNEPIIAGGIINLDWHRGEAWMLHTKLLHKYLKTSLRTLKEELPKIAIANGFKRVQATSFIDNEEFLNILGFHHEATLQCFGPNQETGKLFVRFFDATQ
jgi:hypothetical protein